MNDVTEELIILRQIANAVAVLPFGESLALPWCRESFPVLDEAMKIWEQLKRTNDFSSLPFGRNEK